MIRYETLNLNFELKPEDDKYYERLVAQPSADFWSAWQSKKASMKRAGWFVEKDDKDFVVCLNTKDARRVSPSLADAIANYDPNAPSATSEGKGAPYDSSDIPSHLRPAGKADNTKYTLRGIHPNGSEDMHYLHSAFEVFDICLMRSMRNREEAIQANSQKLDKWAETSKPSAEVQVGTVNQITWTIALNK